MLNKTKMLVGLFLIGGGVLYALAFPLAVHAGPGINQQLNFEGKVVNSNGTNIPDGTYNMEFKVYQDGTNNGTGSALKWTEDYLVAGSTGMPTTGGVTVSGGTFQVNLGSICALASSTCGNKTNAGIDFNQTTLWLSFQVGNSTSCALAASVTSFNTTCGGDGEMTPFIRLTAVPQALNSLAVGGLSAAQLVQLTPGSAQNGNVSLLSGNSVAAGTIQSNTIDAFSSGALTIGSTNATSITIAKNTTVSTGVGLTVQGGNALTLGSTTAAGGIVYQDGTVNNRTITVSSPALTNSYTLAYPTSGATGSTCLQSTSGSTSTVTVLQFGACGGTSTLQSAYNGGANIVLGAGGALKVQDSSTPISGDLFVIANNAGTTKYLGVYAGGLKVYDPSNNANYASITYSGGTAIFGASSGLTQIGSGSGSITASLTGATDNFKYNKTITPGGAYSQDEFIINRTLTAAANTVTGALLRVEDLSTGSALQPTLILANQSNAAATGYLFRASTASVNKVTIDTSGNVVATGTFNATGNVTSSGTIFGNTLDAATSGALTLGGANATSISTSKNLNTTGTALFQPSANSTTAFQVENSAGSPIFLVDTTTTIDLMTYPGFESGSGPSNPPTGWSAVSTAAITQNNVKANTYHGLYSMKVVSSGSGQGAQTSSFTSTPGTGTYVMSFYAETSAGTLAASSLTVTSTDGASHTCTGSASTTLNSSGFQRVYCGFTTTGNITNLSITTASAITLYIDSVQLQTSASTSNPPTAYQIGAIQLRGVISNPVTFSANSNSTTAFQIQSTGTSLNLFTVDSLNNNLQVGSSTASTNGINLVLNNYSNGATEPTEIDGAMYYNSAKGQFRCGESGSWVECVGGLLSSNTANSTTLNGSTLTIQNFSTTSSIPASYCTQGRVIHIVANGITNSSSTTQPESFSVRLGSTPTQVGGASTGYNTFTGVLGGWGIDFYLICNAAPSASSAVNGQGWARVPQPAVASPYQMSGMFSTTTTNFATNAALPITISVTFGGTASATNTIYLTQLIVTGN
jgi:hypothetical protein